MKLIKVLCAWCLAEGIKAATIGEIEVEDNINGPSHGICAHHAKEWREAAKRGISKMNSKEVMPMC